MYVLEPSHLLRQLAKLGIEHGSLRLPQHGLSHDNHRALGGGQSAAERVGARAQLLQTSSALTEVLASATKTMISLFIGAI